MKKLKLILLFLIFAITASSQTNTVIKSKVNATLIDGLTKDSLVQTTAITQTVLGAKDFTGTLSFDGVAFPDGDGTINQIMSTNGAGAISWITSAATTGVLGFDATNIDQVQIFRVADTIAESWAHSHNEYMLASTKAYGTMGFADSSFTIPMTQNIYAPITNTANTLYITGVNYGLTFAGDSIQVPETGDYEIEWDLSYSGANTDLYHIEIFVDGVDQKGKGEGQRDMSSSNIGSSSGHTILSLTALQLITLRIENTINNNDATVYAGNIVINKK